MIVWVAERQNIHLNVLEYILWKIQAQKYCFGFLKFWVYDF